MEEEICREFRRLIHDLGFMLAPPQAPEEIGIVHDAISPFLSKPTSGENMHF
jgi:hypothetical protein